MGSSDCIKNRQLPTHMGGDTRHGGSQSVMDAVGDFFTVRSFKARPHNNCHFKIADKTARSNTTHINGGPHAAFLSVCAALTKQKRGGVGWARGGSAGVIF